MIQQYLCQMLTCWMLCVASSQCAGGPSHHVFYRFQKWKVSPPQCGYTGEQLVSTIALLSVFNLIVTLSNVQMCLLNTILCR